MPVHNSDIAVIFNRVADLLEIEGANPFRVRAYQNAALTISNLSRSLADLVKQGEDPSRLPGIGKDLAGKIKELVNTGRLSKLEEIEHRTPPALLQFLKLPGLGPKRVRTLREKLSLTTLEELKQAGRAGKIRQLTGFGQKIEEQILKEIEEKQALPERTKLVVAEPVAASLVAYLKKLKGVKSVTPAGSFRRRKETIRDLDILITSEKNTRVMEYFIRYEDVNKVVAQGKTRATVILRSGMQVDLRVVPQESYGAALYYFTGSQAHNIAVRKLGVKHRLKINEYGIFRGEKRIAGKTETEIFAQVGLPYIEPELRENQGEIEAAQANTLPRLVRLEDIRGDLHSHTSNTDGRLSLEAMARAAKARGYEYLGITDHSRHVTIAHGMDAKRLFQQIKAIDRLNAKLKGIVLLKGIEVDILEDGKLDLPDGVLKELDFTVCSVHYKFNLSEEKQTERIIRAMDNPYFNILGHPTSRLINERKPYAVDMGRIIQAAKERGRFLELNAHPERLDITDIYCKQAKAEGVRIAISTDAHSDTGLDNMRFGINQARRGWLAAPDVINTRNLQALRKLFCLRF